MNANLIAFFFYSLFFSSLANANNVMEEIAKRKIKSTHGNWSIVCDIPAANVAEQCGIIQNVPADKRSDIILSFVILRSQDRKEKIFRTLAPLGTLLPNGLGLQIDNKNIGKVDFVRCMYSGCYTEIILTKELLHHLTSGTYATFIIFEDVEKAIPTFVHLKGLQEALSQLP